MNILDTDAIIELLRKKTYEAGYISIITLIEVLRGVQDEIRMDVKKLLEESFDMINLDNKVIITYCILYQKLRENGETIPDADLLVAATAISSDLNLKTRDKHFERLKPLGLRIIQP